MIAGIMQPYFFPYIGYFDLICRSDVWVVFDIVQFQPKSWMSRNRVLHPTRGWQYISASLDHKSRNTLISDVSLGDATASRDKILRQLEHYKKHAPCYAAVIEVVQKTFSTASSRLVDINVAGLKAVCEYLKIPFNPIIASEHQFPLPPIEHPGQWALEISAILGADTYLNPPGGRAIFRPEEFKKRGIRLGFTKIPELIYNCAPYTFEPSLSILDVLMWNSPEKVRDYLGRDEPDFVA